MDKMVKRAIYWMLLFLTCAVVGPLIDWYFNMYHWCLYSAIAGVFFLILSVWLLRVSGRNLKKHGVTRDIKFGDTDTLVTTGIYGCIRHPHHLGLAVFVLSVGLLLSSLGYILLCLPIQWLAIYLFVKRVEEPEVIEKFGEAYKEYASRVPAFIPRISCFKKKKS